MYNTAIYARYSTADQSPTSIDDQIRRCRKTLQSKEVITSTELVFQDCAISGSSDTKKIRAGYASLIQAIESREIQCLVADEISRLSRDPLEIMRLKEKIEKYHILFLTANGVDSRTADWSMRMVLSGLMSKAEIESTRLRTKRGMQGQLERGYMIATPAFGYRGVQVTVTEEPETSEDKVKGTVWEIDEKEATIVRKIYAERASGKSLASIAKSLNDQGILSPRPSRAERSIWLPTTIFQILHNRIYRGIFVYQGSSAYLHRVKKSGNASPDEGKEYKRPHLRLVSDEIWFLANRKSAFSGKKHSSDHLLSGLVQCGVCDGILSITSPSHRSRSLYCCRCERNKGVGAKVHTQTISVGVDGAIEVLKFVLNDILYDPQIFSVYQDTLRARLTAGERRRLSELEREVQRHSKIYHNLVDRFVSGEDMLCKQLQVEAEKHKSLTEEHEHLLKRLEHINEAAIRNQLTVSPENAINHLLGHVEKYIYRLRPILQSLFPSIRLMGRLPNKAAILQVTMDLDAATSATSETEPSGSHPVTRCYTVLASKTRPTVWNIDTHLQK